MACVLSLRGEKADPCNPDLVATAMEDECGSICSPNILPSSGSLRLAKSTGRHSRSCDRLGEMV
eukprot:6674040-Pyramimonas_sp.AAC.1